MDASKRKRKIVKFRHWLLLIIIRIICSPAIFIYFWFRLRYFRLKKKGPLLILMNHTTEFDILLSDNLFNFPLYFVASEQLLNKGFVSWLLNYVFAPIPKSKSMSDIAVVPRIKRVLNEGGNVAIFPEGNMTMNGTMSSMPPAIGKLIKLLQVPVVFLESYGLYFSSPRWSRYRKFGPTGIRLKRILEVADYAELTGEKITDIVKSELHTNAYEQWPVRKYRGYQKAAGLHRLVFVCPKCHQPFGMHSRGSKLYCDKCGYEGVYDVYGYVNDEFGRHDTVQLDAQVKRDYVPYVKAHVDDIALWDEVTVRYFVAGAKRRSRQFNQRFTLTKDGLTIADRTGAKQYPFDDILSYTIQTRRKFIVYVRGNLSIVAKMPQSASSYQYLITMQLLHNHHQYLKGSCDYEYFSNPDDIAGLGL
jgi:1-acyl-sn-glycerol-3-phosphate acyltransferase